MASTPAGRILSLDVIRGIAVMGILSVNIVGMAMIQGAYSYPPVYGFHSEGDRIMWALNSIFVDGRFRALFSILFGASLTVVVTQAVEAGKEGWQVHFPRMIVLLLFGCIHYYVLWWGDILVNYAVVGMVAYLFWRLKPDHLLLAAALVLSTYYIPQFVDLASRFTVIEQSHAPDASPELRQKARKMLTPPSASSQEIVSDTAEHASIPAHIEASIRGDAALEPWQGILGYGIETLGFMLIGMAGFKSGFLTGAWSKRRYVTVAAACLAIDLAVQTYAAIAVSRADFAPITYFPWTSYYLSPLRPVGAIGYAALIMLLFNRRGAIADRFAAVGRAAFTNYLGSTIVGTLLFYGTFGGLYGQLSRGQAWLFVPFVWAFMLLWSKPWLDRFNYGPFEWAWRSLSRWKLQPMRKHPPVPVPAEAGFPPWWERIKP
jgi:uncharacterized protein